MTVPPQTTGAPRLLYVSTLDHIIRVMLPHLDAARAAGFTVEVACRLTRFGDEVRAHADAVHDLPLCRFPLHPANARAAAQLVQLLRARPCAIVHAHNPTGGLVGRLAATRAHVPVRVYTAHGFHFHRHGGRVANALYRNVERLAGHRLSDGVIVINGEDYQAALQGDVVPPDRLFLTGGVGVSTNTFDPALVGGSERRRVRAELGVEDAATPILTLIGEMIPRKRHADALAAFVHIRARFEQAVLVLAGDGVLMNDLKARARALGVWESCRFLGFRRDVRALLRATDVFLFPSAQEGLPCSVQEALAMAVPVVATDVRGNRDLVDPSCGRLVKLGDTNALARAAIELLLLDEEARQRLGARGRAKMVAQYDRALCVAQWLEVYRTLLARRGLALPNGVAQTPLPARSR